MKQNTLRSSYLDVSELVLKQHSPLFKPKPAPPTSEVIPPSAYSLRFHSRALDECWTILHFPPREITQIHSHAYEIAHDASPILDSKMNFAMTPLFEKNKLDPLRDHNFDELESFTLDVYIDTKSKKSRRGRSRLPSSWYIVENELQDIIEEYDSENAQDFYSQSDENNSEEESQNEDENEDISEEEIVQVQGEKQSSSHYEVTNYEFKSEQWQAPNPKKELISKLKSVIANPELKDVEQKITVLKQTFQKYLCDHEKYYFDQCLSSLSSNYQNINQILNTLIKGIEQTFKRQIGGLSFQKRRLKLLRYLDKKKRRVWRKKVSYDCRKKVADGRLRIKGKFVTHEQACQQLGLASVQGYTPDQIKEMLYKKMQNS